MKMGEKNPSAPGFFWIPLFTVVLGAFAAILNNSSVNVAIPKLMAIFGVDTDRIQWVVTTYMLTSGVVIPVTGFLGDYLGSKRLYVIALSVFTLGSLLCSLAWSLNIMIVARIIQGIGGGAIMPVSMAIIYKIAPRDKIGSALGVWGIAAMAAPVIGPTLGGYVIDRLNWHFIFSLNIPVGILGILLAVFLLPSEKPHLERKFDFWGFVLVTGGCFALLLALSQGHKEGWASQYIVNLLLGGSFALILFVIIEVGQDNPILDIRILKNKIFSLSIVASGLMTIGLFGGVFLIPLFTQNIQGLTPLQTGLLLMPAAIVTGLVMPLSGILFDLIGFFIPGLIGLFITAWGTWELHILSLETSMQHIQFIMVIRSIGMGLAMMPITTAGMNTISNLKIGEASALSNVIRQIAASFGIALLTSILQQRQIFHAARLSEAVSVPLPVASSIINQLGQQIGLGREGYEFGLGLLAMQVQRLGFTQAIGDTFLVATLFVFLAIPFVILMKHRNKTVS